MLRQWQRCARPRSWLRPYVSPLARSPGGARTLSSSPTAQEAGVADPVGYCKEYVRKRDYESYLIASFYPRHLQGAFFALRAFYVSNHSPAAAAPRIQFCFVHAHIFSNRGSMDRLECDRAGLLARGLP